MNKRLRVGIPRDLLQRIFLASDSNIFDADLILASMSVEALLFLTRCQLDDVMECIYGTWT